MENFYPHECLDAPSESVAVDTSIKLLQIYNCMSERIYISQGIDKFVHVFMFSFIGKFITTVFEFIILHEFMTET